MGTLRSKAFARILDLICEGEIEGLVDGKKSIYLDGTPVQSADGTTNFQDVEYVTRNGTNAQTYIPGIPAAENEVTVSAEVTNALSLVRTITNSEVNAFRIRVATPALFRQKDDGSLADEQIDFRVEVQPSGGSYSTVKNFTFNGKTTQEYERSYELQLTGDAPWNIRLTRLTSDNTDNPRIQNRSYWQSYTEIINQKLRYPNSALASLKFNSEYFDSIPSRAYDVKLLKVKVPSNYNPVTRAYTGIWDGTFKTEKAWTDNPAWCFYDLLTNTRYGLGNYLSEAQVDKWGLYSIARYCDELVGNGEGGTEPRFTCNIYIQSRKEAFNVIQDFASIFRGMVYWSAGQLTATQDSPADPVALFTPANIEDGSFNYSGSAAKARHTVALVTWNDPEDQYKQKVEYVEDAVGIARYGVSETEITAIGCTSRGQANRVGRWLLFSEQYETETVSFTTGIEGCLARPGQIIKVADPTRAGVRLGGRITAATLNTITVDGEFTLPATSTVYVVLPNGTVQSKTVSSKSGKVLTLSSNLSATPQAGAVWVLSAPTVEAQTFRVVSVTESDEGKVSITALKHDPNKYAAVENGLKLQPRDITELRITPPAPTSVTASEALYKYNDEVRVRIDVGWVKSFGANRYRVQWIKDGGNINEDITSDDDFEILNVTPGSYQIRVYAIGPTGLSSTAYGSTTLNVLGKTAPPADVTGFTQQVDPALGVTLSWTAVADLDLQGYEIRRGASWGAGTVVARNVSATVFTVGELLTGTTTFLIKALDTSGNYSANAASVAVTIVASAAPTVTGAFVGQNLVLNWEDIRGTFLTDAYEIRYGTTFAGGTSLGNVKGTTFSTKAQWSGTRSFWVAAIDMAGNVGTAGKFEAVVLVPVAVTATQEVIDNNVLLRWTDGEATLPLESYEVRRGDVYSTATIIGRTASQFTTIFETTAGTFRYWITGIDVAGNFGSSSSVLASVAQPPDYRLQFDINSIFDGTKSNLVADDDGSLVGGTDTTETWEDHFTSRSWSTPQDQIDAGFPYYLQPTATTAYYEEEIDYGTVLAGTKISTTLTYTTVSGSVSVNPNISVKKLAGDPWIDYDGLSSVFVTDFRYAKIRYTFTSAGGDDIVGVTGLNVRFDVKLINDAGSGYANSADSGGTTVSFNVPFVDVQSISVTPLATSAVIAVYDFVDAPNPTGFKVLLFNTSGTRVSGDFSWAAKGV